MQNSTTSPRRRPAGPRPRTDTKHGFVGGPVPRDLRNAVIDHAAERGISISALLRDALRRYLEQEQEAHDAGRS